MDENVRKVGSVAAFAAAATYLALSFTAWISPAIADFDEFLSYLAGSPVHYYINRFALVFLALTLIPVITAVTQALSTPRNAGVLRWAAVVGYIGCGGFMAGCLREVSMAPLRARAYLEGDELARAAIAYNWEVGLDPDRWLQYGAVGLWIAVVCVAALMAAPGERGPFSRRWASLGLLGALIQWTIVVVNFTGADLPASVLGMLAGFFVGLPWAFLTGVALRRTTSAVGYRATTAA